MQKSIFKISILVILISVVLASCQTEKQPLSVAQVFTNNMVLQANKQVNIWGTATPKTKVNVTIRNQHKRIKVDINGNWLIKLDAETYGDAGSLNIVTKTDTIELSNILFGEVWVCSGQSNMEMPLVSNWAHVNNVNEEVKQANYPEIRLFSVDKNIAFQPIDTIGTIGWQICDTNTVKDFSATAYFFGLKLYQELNVPIGLVNTSWGGTVAETWTSKEALMETSDFAEKAIQIAAMNGSRDSLQKKYEADMAQMQREVLAADKGFEGKTAVFANPDFDDSDWMAIDFPKMWEETEMGVFDGSGWFRKSITLSTKQAKQNWVLHYGAPDDYDEAWVNGVKIGENKEWNVLREYKVPEGLLREGKNMITLRVYDYTGGGGFMGEAQQFKMVSDAGKTIPIAKNWVGKKGFDFNDIDTKPVSLTNPNQPTVLYNAMINPLIPLTFQGAIWYQGESNSGRAKQYRNLFKTMINDWRNNFDNGNFPFYFVQLANYLQRNSEPVEDAWAELREAQTMALELPNTGMAVTIDIGDALNIHPGNKQDVGNRLALNALANTYGKEIEYMGPLYKTYSVNKNTIVLEFEFNEELASKDEQKLSGFSIAGTDSIFVWAEAKIIGNKVIVSSKKVQNPIAVRYAWASNPACNLTNKTGLPASPFRTDDWQGITE